MADFIVKLYDLSEEFIAEAYKKRRGITIRKPMGCERGSVKNWVRENFDDGWANEAEAAMSNSPISCFIAVQDNEILGYSGYDSTCLGMYGPVGVAKRCRGLGIGKALLSATLLDMKAKGYMYAIIGNVGPEEFYKRTVGAIEIEDSLGYLKTRTDKENPPIEFPLN